MCVYDDMFVVVSLAVELVATKPRTCKCWMQPYSKATLKYLLASLALVSSCSV